MKLFTGADLIIYFFIYGILAWVLNTVIYSLKEQKYINTGVLNIPIIGCPAFIMILMIIVSSGKNVSYYGMLMMAFIDYFILDRMGLFFSQRLLLKKEINSLRDNYGKSLKLSCINAIIVVGICFVLFKTLHPIVFSFVSLIPGIIVNIIALVLAVLLIADIVTIYIFVRKYPMKNMDTNIASRKNTFGEWISKHIWYSYMPFNIDGRTNLLFMFFWGIVALVWFKFIYPPFSKFIEKIPPVTGSVLAVFIALFFICNGTVTSMVMIRTTDRKKHPEARNVIEQFIDNEYPNEVVRKLWPNMNFLEE